MFKKGDTHWNKGKTKETDLRIARSGEIQSKTKKKLFSKGKLIPWNKGRRKDTSTTPRIPAPCVYCGKSITKLGKGSESLFTKNGVKYHRACYFKTPAFTDKMSKIGIEKWRDKTVRSNIINGLRRTAQSPPKELDKTETCAYCGETIIYRGWTTMSLYVVNKKPYHRGCYQKTPKARRKNSEGFKNRYKDPHERIKLLERLSERACKYWADPNKRKEQSIRMSEICNRPTYLKNLHTGQKRFHDSLTPEQTLKRLKKSMFKGCISPNKSEKQIGKIVEHEPFHFKFTGGIRNPECAIAGYFVDWTWVEMNAAMDFHGPGGHDPSVPWVPENKAELDDIRSQRIRDTGWNYCILTEEDRQDIDKLILKVTIFVEKCKRSDS